MKPVEFLMDVEDTLAEGIRDSNKSGGTCNLFENVHIAISLVRDGITLQAQLREELGLENEA